jgi:acetoacetate decarboxylase
VPESPEVVGDRVHYEFILMPDLTGFGEYMPTRAASNSGS